MALTRGWEKRKPHGLSGFKNREMLWLWCRLEEDSYKLDPNKVNNADSRANYLIDQINYYEIIVGKLSGYRNECFSNRLDDSEFKWIKYNDRRLLNWIIGILCTGFYPISVAYTNFDQSVLAPREQILLSFDISKESISVKKEMMNKLHDIWSSLIEIDPHLEWVNKQDEVQCRWLVDEIRSSDIAQYISPDLQSPVNNEDRFLLFVNTLDRTGFPLKPKKLFVNDIKAKWNRKKKKESTEKVQCNLNVLFSTKEYIEKLADDRSLKMGELIDALIAEEMKRKY